MIRCVVVLLAIGCAPARRDGRMPPPAVTPAAIGETFTLDSKVLGERRRINVYLPPGYRDGPDPYRLYPVLYMPDGGLAEDFPHVAGAIDVSIKNAVIRPMIVVGIENTERRRDLVGPTAIAEEQKAAPHAGGSTKFRAFLRDELKPLIERMYHASAESAIVGESLAGLFVVETLLAEPALFDTYIAIDPSVWWNAQALVKTAAARFAAWSAPPRRLWVATSSDQTLEDGLGTLLAAHPPAGLAIEHVELPAEKHSTIYPVAALRAFRTLFGATARR